LIVRSLRSPGGSETHAHDTIIRVDREGEATMARIDKIVDGIYRISTTFNYGEYDFSFDQFLIDDERPALIHTGMYAMYDDIRGAVGEVLDPGKLEYVILLHFESDECGGMDRFLEGAPASALACSAASVELNLAGWNYRGRVEGHQDGEVIDLGEHKLRFLETPHVHHWDSMMLFEEKTKSLFPSDLFIQPGDQPPVVSENLGTEMCGFYREMGIFAHEAPVRDVVERIVRLDPDWIHGMHGGSLPRETIPDFVRALREEPFAYQGKVLGRELPVDTPGARA
jgi:flavorubredoxin